MQNQPQMQEKRDASKRTALDPMVLAAGASVLLSWAVFYGKGDKQQGLFIGLWPPTLLAFASYFRQNEMKEAIETRGVSGIVSRVQQAIEQQ